ncbi:ATP-binding cassette domain-containing protein [Methylobacterium sp. PvR107]|uniref:ATP-binding cassette domain-containing protein n=1 Tax=Methylobacterium sp. PvR107 TaxID=2806597 RepID=UPI003918334B
MRSGIDLTVRAGERVALMGRSGAGKSTLIGLIHGQAPASVALVPQAAASGIPADGRSSWWCAPPRNTCWPRSGCSCWVPRCCRRSSHSGCTMPGSSPP